MADAHAGYAAGITKHFVPSATALGTGVGVLTVLLGSLAAYIAIAILLNGAANKVVLPIGGPLIAPAVTSGVVASSS